MPACGSVLRDRAARTSNSTNLFPEEFNEIDPEHSVYDEKRVLDEWVVRATNSITNQFKKTGINDCIGRKFNAITGALIGQDHSSTIWILIRTVIDVAWVNADVVPGQPGDQSPLRRDCPTFHM